MIFRKVPTGVRERERRGGEGHGRDHEAHKEARAQVARLRPPPKNWGTSKAVNSSQKNSLRK